MKEQNFIVERKFRNEQTMVNYINNKWMISKLKEKYSPTEYTAKVNPVLQELRIYKRN